MSLSDCHASRNRGLIIPLSQLQYPHWYHGIIHRHKIEYLYHVFNNNNSALFVTVVEFGLKKMCPYICVYGIFWRIGVLRHVKKFLLMMIFETRCWQHYETSYTCASNTKSKCKGLYNTQSGGWRICSPNIDIVKRSKSTFGSTMIDSVQISPHFCSELMHGYILYVWKLLKKIDRCCGLLVV